jgi:hypothetical protein
VYIKTQLNPKSAVRYADTWIKETIFQQIAMMKKSFIDNYSENYRFEEKYSVNISA